MLEFGAAGVEVEAELFVEIGFETVAARQVAETVDPFVAKRHARPPLSILGIGRKGEDVKRGTGTRDRDAGHSSAETLAGEEGTTRRGRESVHSRAGTIRGSEGCLRRS